MICPYCSTELVEVDNPFRREIRHRRGVQCPSLDPAFIAPPPHTLEDARVRSALQKAFKPHPSSLRRAANEPGSGPHYAPVYLPEDVRMPNLDDPPPTSIGFPSLNPDADLPPDALSPEEIPWDALEPPGAGIHLSVSADLPEDAPTSSTPPTSPIPPIAPTSPTTPPPSIGNAEFGLRDVPIEIDPAAHEFRRQQVETLTNTERANMLMRLAERLQKQATDGIFTGPQFQQFQTTLGAATVYATIAHAEAQERLAAATERLAKLKAFELEIELTSIEQTEDSASFDHVIVEARTEIYQQDTPRYQ